MADALYLKIMEALSADPSSGGVDPREFNWPDIGPDPTQDFSVPPDYLSAMTQFQPAEPPLQATPPQTAQPAAAPQPFFKPSRRKIGMMMRPGQFMAELIQGGDPMGALMEGRATKETLGRAMFEGSQEKGFQMADLPAFAVDVLTDPLTYILPPVLGRSFKAIGSLFGKSTSVRFFADSMQDIMGRTGQKAQASAMKRLWKPADQVGGIGMTDEWMRELMVGAKIAAPGAERKLMKDLGKFELDKLMSYMQNIEYQVFQPSSGLFGQALNRAGLHLAPIVSVLEKQGGVLGQRFAQGIKGTMRGTLENYGRVANDYLKFVDDLGLSNQASIPIRGASTILAEAGGKAAPWDDIQRVIAQHGDVSDDIMAVFSNPEALSKAEALAGKNREIMDLYKNILSGFRDASGKGFNVQTDRGAVPFAKAISENYMPHMFDWANIKVGTKGYKSFVRNFMKQRNIKSYAQAESMIETMYRKTPKKFGNIEHARTMELGGYHLDPLEFLPQWLYKTEYRMNFAKQFGINGNSAKQLAKGAKEAGLDARWVDDIEAILLDRHPRQYEVSQLINKFTGFQVLTKMGFGSAVANASQSINTMAVFGIGNFMKGVVNAFTDEGARFGALAYNRATKEAIEQMMTGAKGNTMAARYLDATGFNWVEKWNRFFAANTGVASLKNSAAQLARAGLGTREGAKIAARLARTVGSTQDDLVRLASGQVPGREMLDRAALLASENTQHATHWHQLPKMWQNPEAKIALQYKNFAYNQARFMHQQIITPAMEYLASNGKLGDITPLMRTVPLFTTAGQAVSHLRDLMRIPIRGVMSGDWEAREEWLWDQDDEWFSGMLKDSMTVGAFGMLGDMFTAAERGKLPQWALGPTVGDVTDLVTRGIRLGKGTQDMDKSFDRFATWMGRRVVPPALSMIPGVGPTLAGVAQQYPYDLTYGDIDMTRFIRDLEKLRAGQR